MVDNKTIDVMLVVDEMNFNLLTRKIKSELNSDIVIHPNGHGLAKDAQLYQNLDLVIVDQQYAKGDLSDSIKYIKRKSPATEVLVLSSDKEAKTDIKKAGAYDFIYKDASAFEKVAYLIKSLWIKKELIKENASLKLRKKKASTAIGILLFIIVVILASFVYLVASNSL